MRSGVFQVCDGLPRTRVARASAEQCLVIKIVVTRDARVNNEWLDSPGGEGLN